MPIRDTSNPTRSLSRGCARLGVVLAAALAGCAVAPLPRLPDEAPSRWQAEGRAAAAAPDLRGWWKAFDDPELDRLVDAALKDNLNALIADLNKSKPSTAKGVYLQRVYLSSTMGLGIPVDQATLSA